MEDDAYERPSKRPKVSPNNGNESLALSAPETERLQTSSLNVTDSREVEVGITAFVTSNTKPFTAILKKRYTDFLVNEILPNGDIVHLSSTRVPERFQSKAKAAKKEQPPVSNVAALIDPSKDVDSESEATKKQESHEEDSATKQDANNLQPAGSNWISEEDKQQLIRYLNAGAVSELLSLYQATYKFPQRKPKEHPFVRTDFTSDRSERAEIHGCIRRIFSSRIESSTDKDGYLVLTAANPNSRQSRQRNAAENKPSRRPGKLDWAERGGEYLHFTLYKENKDTMEAVSWLVRQMKINAKTFQFAGTKDRRAVTAQRVSAYRIDAERLAGQNRSLRGAKVGDFEYQEHGLELGDLTGNEFTITLRDCHFDELEPMPIEGKVKRAHEILEASIGDLHSKGYLNYFGLQRFGTFVTRTDTVGLHILKGDYQAAVEAILDFDPTSLTDEDKASIGDSSYDVFKHGYRPDDTVRSLALMVYQKTSNSHKAMEILPRKFSAEASLIRHLQRAPADYLGALMNIQRNLRLMYVHAYQSLVWNNAITQRMAKYGSTVVEGDLVLISEHRDKNVHPVQGISTNVASTSTPASIAAPGPGDVDADGEIIITPAVHDRASNIDDAFERARHLTAEEARSGQYSIFDIVLPLPGYDILYPDHETGSFYKTFMAANGNLDPMDMRRKQRDFSLSGSYRKILSRIGQGWTVEVKTYTGDDEQFVQTDMEILSAKEKTHQQENGNGETLMSTATTAVPEGLDDMVTETEMAPEKIAAILKFKLGSSQYATMALRELSHGGIVAYKPDSSGVKAHRS